jgi:hypothetical protein
MRAGEGTYASTEPEARQFAQKISDICGGGGNVVRDAAQPGKYAHYRALDKAGNRIPGHVRFGNMGALLSSIVDVDADGIFTPTDVFELANPFPVPLTSHGVPNGA